jgi:hypothetical protein
LDQSINLAFLIGAHFLMNKSIPNLNPNLEMSPSDNQLVPFALSRGHPVHPVDLSIQKRRGKFFFLSARICVICGQKS